MSKEEFIMTIWTEDQYICISVLPSDEAGPRKNLTVGKIYIGLVEDGLDDYLYVVENDRGNDQLYPIELFKKVSKNREEKLNILLDS